MLQRILLENFRGFRAVGVETRPVTVLAGPNSSGKSTILHAVRLALFCLAKATGEDESTARLSSDGSIVFDDIIVRDHTRLLAVLQWQELFLDSKVGPGIVAAVALDFEEMETIQGVRVDLSYARNGVLKLSVVIRSPTIVKSVEDAPKRTQSQRIREAIHRSGPNVVLVPAFYGVSLNEEYRTDAIVHRLLESGEQSRVVRNLIARLSGPAFTRLNSFLQRSVGARLEYRDTQQDAWGLESLVVRFSDTNGKLELSSAGAGLVNLVTLFSALEMYRDQRTIERSLIFLLDEPEAHLHPKLQGQIGVELASLVAEFGAQLILATHSVEMINQIGQRNDSVLIAVDRASSRAIALTTESEIVRELDEWCDLTPFASLNFLASRRILFHEGKSDAEILRMCARAMFRNDDAKRRLFEQWTLVSLDGVGNGLAPSVLSKILAPKLFPALDAKEAVRVVVILDHDCSRKQKFDKTAPEPHLAILDVVWSRYSIESLFLEPGCLAGWLSASVSPLAVDESTFAHSIREALAEADGDRKLLDDAEDALGAAYRKEGDSAKDAQTKSRKTAREHPEVWQKGKDRAAIVLKRVRQTLPPKHQNEVRGSIADVLRAASIDRLGDLTVIIPAEISAVLDYMVTNRPGTKKT